MIKFMLGMSTAIALVLLFEYALPLERVVHNGSKNSDVLVCQRLGDRSLSCFDFAEVMRGMGQQAQGNGFEF